jgi:hypothetical protein
VPWQGIDQSPRTAAQSQAIGMLLRNQLHAGIVGVHEYGVGAMAGNLRLDHERRLVAQIFPRWNRVADWLREAEGYAAAA